MLEDNLRTLFTLEAEVAQPRARISVPTADRATRPRRRLAVAIGAPVLAAAAVVAVVTASALLGPGPTPGPGPGALVPAAGPARIPATDFSPLLVYASFGWLPAGTKVANGGTGVEWQVVNAAGPKASPLAVSSLWSLSVFAPGECRWQRVAGAGSSQRELACSDHAPLTLTGSAPLVDGRPGILGRRVSCLALFRDRVGHAGVPVLLLGEWADPVPAPPVGHGGQGRAARQRRRARRRDQVPGEPGRRAEDLAPRFGRV